MLQGYIPVPIEHFGGLICSWPPESLDVSLLTRAVNLRFTGSEVMSREGLTRAFKTPNKAAITGLVDYVHLDGTEQPVVLDATGNLYVESPGGSGHLAAADPGSPYDPPVGSFMNGVAAYDRVYMAFGDGKNGLGVPASFDGTNLDPVTIAAPPAGTALADDDVPGHVASGLRYAVVMYRTREGSLTPASPPFSYTGGSIASPPPQPTVSWGGTGGTLPAGTYYVVITWKNGAGETTASAEAAVYVAVSNQGYIQIRWPSPPPTATQVGVYVSTSSGAETLQAYQAAITETFIIAAAISTGGAVPPATNTAGLKVGISSVPVGPAQVVARVVAFTVAGGSSSGPFYYIEEAQTVNGIAETSTVIPDNVSTAAAFDFDDNFLASSLDASDQQRAILLPNECGCFFSQTTQRMMWWGDPAQPSVVQCSEVADAGLYLGDTGFFQVSENDGQRVTAVFEYRNLLYVAKQDSLYLVTPNDGDPATWAVEQVSPGVGCCSARAAAVGTGYVLLVHRSGVYQFAGGVPQLVSGELSGPSQDRPGLWERINWAYEHLIWTAIDHEAKCVRIGVPLDGATMCSHILKVSYIDGWEYSIRFSAFTARYHYFPGRRWSIDEIAATQAVRVKRTIALGNLPPDRRTGQSQMLLGSAVANGEVDYVDPAATADNGVPFAWLMETGAISAAELLKQQRQGMESVGIVQFRARGSGNVDVAYVADEDAPKSFMTLALDDRLSGDFSGLALAQGEAVRLRLSGSVEAPSAMRLVSAYAFARPSWALRPGK